MLGNWRCREMKLGGISPYMVYKDWFRCSIRAVHGGLMFRKLTGTQRTSGFLYPQDGAWIYLGASSAKNEPWHRYSGRFASLGADTTPDDQVGALVGIGRNMLRIDLPEPSTLESEYDAIQLVR